MVSSVVKLHINAGHRVRVAGSGPTKGMPVLSVTRQREWSNGLDAVTKGTTLRTVLSPPIMTEPTALLSMLQTALSTTPRREALSDTPPTKGDIAHG
eukprot:357907-Chlamydomonas_euryale.AAC.10